MNPVISIFLIEFFFSLLFFFFFFLFIQHRQELRTLETKLKLENKNGRELALVRSQEELASVTESLKQSHTIVVEELLREIEQYTIIKKETILKEKKYQNVIEERCVKNYYFCLISQ